jgi:hypothetical protein
MERKPGQHDIGIMTFRACDIDLEKTLHREINREVTYKNRMNEVSDVVGSAIGLSTMCMAPAIGEIAIDVMNSPDMKKKIGDWEIEAATNDRGNIVNMLLKQPGQQGAWHLGVVFGREMSDLGKKRKTFIDYDEKIRLEEMTPQERREDAVSQIKFSFSKDKKEDPFKADMDNYRFAERGDEVKAINGTALKASLGPPARVSSDDAVKLKGFWPIQSTEKMEIWWPGVALGIRPETVPGSKYSYEKRFNLSAEEAAEYDGPINFNLGRTNTLTGPELLRVAGELIEASGYSDMVRDASQKLAVESFWNSDVVNSVDLAEIGIAAVLADEGFYGDTIQRSVETFSAGIAQSDFARIREDVYMLIKCLDENGYSSKEKDFDCNDMRDSAYLTHEEFMERINVETQHGKYAVDLDAQSGTFTAYRKSGVEKFLGEFKDTDDFMSGRAAAYTADNIRDLNGLISVLPSLSHCIQDEHKPDEGMEP